MGKSRPWKCHWLIFRFTGEPDQDNTLIDGVIAENERDALLMAGARNPVKPNWKVIARECSDKEEWEWMKDARSERNQQINEIRQYVVQSGPTDE